MMKSIMAMLLLAQLFLYSCDTSRPAKDREGTITAASFIDSVQVIHDKRDVTIGVQGRIDAWKKVQLMASDTAKLISLLVEEGAKVEKGDRLASLWSYSNRYEYTPIDLSAPMSGVVTGVHFQIQDKIPADKPIITLKNYRHLLLEASLDREQMDYINKGNEADMIADTLRMRGSVYQLDKKNNTVSILGSNKGNIRLNNIEASAKIHCGKMDGDFIEDRFFRYSDQITIETSDRIQLDVKKIGQADSLALIFPPLPDQVMVRVRVDSSEKVPPKLISL